jgi:hypothetical protein
MVFQQKFLLVEEFYIFWIELGLIIMSYTYSHPSLIKGSLEINHLFFPIGTFIAGVLGSLIGFFYRKNSWRRLQGMSLMVVAIGTLAFVTSAGEVAQ